MSSTRGRAAVRLRRGTRFGCAAGRAAAGVGGVDASGRRPHGRIALALVEEPEAPRSGRDPHHDVQR